MCLVHQFLGPDYVLYRRNFTLQVHLAKIVQSNNPYSINIMNFVLCVTIVSIYLWLFNAVLISLKSSPILCFVGGVIREKFTVLFGLFFALASTLGSISK